MSDEREPNPGGWRIVEGPGTEDADREDLAPELGDLGNEPVPGAGYGASTGGLDGEPGPPGPALGEIPEHTGPNAIAGIGMLTPPDEEE